MSEWHVGQTAETEDRHFALLNCEQAMTVGNWNGTGRQGDWELVGTYPTMETARAQVEALQREGVESRITMIEGLCVIARVGNAEDAAILIA